ncbi:TPA: hypothetical protein TU158_001845 [Streptococcus equi subsp. zooepidemicus]|nr:hypothetical protein [Streptococcus equi subsp. zooepidemicus]
MTTKKQTGLLMSIRQAKRKNRKKKILSISSIISMLVIFFPTTAFAYEGEGTGLRLWAVGEKISNMICSWLLDLAQWIFTGYFELVKASTDTSYISGTFSSLFGSRDLYELVETVHSTAVIPLAESILALFMLVQLVKISQRIDATATLPTVKDIIILAVAYVIFHWLIVNSLDIIADIFDEFNKIVTSLQGNSAIQAAAIDFSSINLDEVTVGNCIMLVLCGLISYIIGLIAYLISLIVSMARGVQLYVMASFAPIPLSLLGFEETRQSGINFLKNFCALCLAGAIMMFMFISYPILITSTVATLGSDAFYGIAQGTISTTPIFSLATWLAVSILLCIGLVKSGAWAKEILGS